MPAKKAARAKALAIPVRRPEAAQPPVGPRPAPSSNGTTPLSNASSGNGAETQDDENFGWGTFPTFVVFDPFESLFSGRPPAFRNADGTPLVSLTPDAHALLTVAHQAADALSGSDREMSRDDLLAVLQDTRDLIEVMRTNLPLETMRFCDEFGNPIEGPGRTELDEFGVVSLVHQATAEAHGNLGSVLESWRAALPQLWGVLALDLVDKALAPGDGGDVWAAVEATMAVANANAMQAMITGSNPAPLSLGIAAAVKAIHSERGRKAADARHSAPGGARDKGNRIRDIWASGKYSSRDVCAEQECAALDMSFSSARKALRGTPDPT